MATKQNIGVTGITGSNKTSTWVFCTNVIEADKIDLMMSKLYYNKIKLYFLDFNLIDAYINEKLDIYKSRSDREYHLFALFLLTYFGYDYSLYIKTAFKVVNIVDMLAEYIKLYYILNFRPSNVVSNVSIYSENTGQFPFIVNENYTTMFKNMDFKLEEFMIFFDDEKGIFDNYKISMKKTAAAIDEADDGKSEFFMLFRHAFKGTTTRIGIQQNLEDFIANQRRQYQVIFDMGSSEQIIVYGFEKSLTSRFIQFTDVQEQKYYKRKTLELQQLKKPCRKYYRLAFKLDGYFDRPNNFKKIKSKLLDLKDWLENKEIIIQRMSLYNNPADVGKDVYKDNPNTKALAFPLTLFIPKNRSWSFYDTYSYQNIFRKLKRRTKGSILVTDQFKHLTPSANDFSKMNYAAFKKINQKIDKKIIVEDDF